MKVSKNDSKFPKFFDLSTNCCDRLGGVGGAAGTAEQGNNYISKSDKQKEI